MAGRQKFANVDEYIQSFPEETQKILAEVRNTIKSVAPEATEKISYNIPAFFYRGKYLIYYSGYQYHFSLYPIFAGEGDAELQKELEPHLRGKGTAQFKISEPIPHELIKKIVKFKFQKILEKER